MLQRPSKHRLSVVVTETTIGVTVTDGTNFCSASTTIQVSQPTPIVVSVTTTDNLCFGGSTGTANTKSQILLLHSLTYGQQEILHRILLI